MDPSGFNPAFPFPVPTTVGLPPPQPPTMIPDLSLPPPPPPDPEVNNEANAESNEIHSSRRKRGRPRKLKPTTEPSFELPTAEPESVVNGAPVGGEVVLEKRAARPVKRYGSEIARWEKKKKKVGGKAVLRGPLGYPKRGRGRPPKDRSVDGVFNGRVSNVMDVAGVKRRGRPKRALGNKVENVVQKWTGWNPGRGGSRVLGPAEPQWMVDYAHVRAKIDHVQSRMREAIGVIKPHLMNQIMTNSQIGSALQELDQLSTMDVMAVSLVDEAEAPAETRF